jgi:hypothetical protein
LPRDLTQGVDFGTLSLGAVDAAGSPVIGVTNCSGIGATIYARGTNASSAGATWSLTDATTSCADSLGLDVTGFESSAPAPSTS